MSKPKQQTPKTEEPEDEKRYKVLRLKASLENRAPDRGFAILDNRCHSVVVDGFETAKEALAFIDEHLSPRSDPKPRLKTMDEISAAEAAKIFHGARNFRFDRDPSEDYCLLPEYFPQDIAARDFLQCLDLYTEMYNEGMGGDRGARNTPTSYTVEHRDISDEQRSALVEIASTISDPDLDKKLPVGSREREVFDVLRQNPGISNLEIGEKLNISESTVKTHLLRAFHKLELEGGRKEVWAKYPPRKT